MGISGDFVRQLRSDTMPTKQPAAVQVRPGSDKSIAVLAPLSSQLRLVPTESRFPSTIFHAVIVRLGISYAGFLRLPDDFGLSLSRRSYYWCGAFIARRF